MSKPNAEEYAKILLWHISALRAEVRSLHMRFADHLAKQSGVDSKQLQKQWMRWCDRDRKQLYLQALKEAGLHNHDKTKGEGENGI